MSKEKFGKYFFYFALVLAFGLIFAGTTLAKNQTVPDLSARIRNVFSFLGLGLFLPAGLIVREYLSVPHDLLKMTWKTIIASAVFACGMLVILLAKGTLASQLVIYGSLISLVYILIPSKTNEQKI